ncbi:MAG: tetratricopeptide repeat protein [Asticcacaulis sp.]
MSDIFEETEENLRAEQWLKIARTTLPWVGTGLAAALAIALGIWGFQVWQQKIAAHASEVYEAGLDANSKADKVGAKTKFEEAAKAGNATYKAMALMQLAALADLDKNTDEAVKDLDEAAKATNNPLLQDTAAIKAAYLLMDKSSLADTQKRLAPLMKDGRPAAALAKEALAMAKLQSGDLKGARTDLNLLSLTLGTPDGIKQRAAAAVAAIDSGAAQTAVAVAKLPPAPAPVLPEAPGLAAVPPDGAPTADGGQ